MQAPASRRSRKARKGNARQAYVQAAPAVRASLGDNTQTTAALDENSPPPQAQRAADRRPPRGGRCRNGMHHSRRLLKPQLMCMVLSSRDIAHVAGKRKRMALTETAIDQESAPGPANTKHATAQRATFQKGSPPDKQPKRRRQKMQKVKQLADIYTAAAAPADEVVVAQHADDEPACGEPADKPLKADVPPGEQPPVCSVGDGTGHDAASLLDIAPVAPKERRCCGSSCPR